MAVGLPSNLEPPAPSLGPPETRAGVSGAPPVQSRAGEARSSSGLNALVTTPAADRLLVPGLVMLVALTVYRATLCPTVSLGDGGELTTCAYTLGIPHPTGYPLYCLAGKVASWLLPGLTVAWRLNLWSSVLAAATAAMSAWVALVATGSGLGGLLTGLTLALTAPLWSQALSAEVYTLHAALMMAQVLAFTLAWERAGQGRSPDRCLLACAALFGLGCTNHITTVTFAPGLAVGCLWLDPSLMRAPRRLGKLAAAALLPLLLYAYLPLRSLANPPNDWGDPQTLSRFLDHVRGAQYQGRLGAFTSSEWLGNAAAFARKAAGELGPAGCLFALVGLAALGASVRPLLAMLLLLALANVAFYSNYLAFDVSDFYLPAHLVAALFAGLGVARGEVAARRLLPTAVALALVFVAVALPAGKLAVGWPQVDRSGFAVARDYALNLFRSAGPGALVFAEGSSKLFPMEYLQLCEGVRPDVRLIHRHGQIFGELYRGRTDAAGRLAAEDEAILAARGEVAFTSRRSLATLPGWRLVPWGLLHRALPPGTTPARPGRESLPVFTDWPVEPLREEYKTREVMGEYALFAGLARLGQGRIPEALASFAEVTRVAHDVFYLQGELGQALVRARLWRPAREVLARALRLPEGVRGEDRSAVWRNLGLAESGLRRYRQAAAALRKALQQRPGYEAALVDLARVEQAQGNRGTAGELLRRARQLGDSRRRAPSVAATPAASGR